MHYLKTVEYTHLAGEINSLYHEAAIKMGVSDSVMNILYVICEKGKMFSSAKIFPLFEIENKIWDEWTAEEQQQYLMLTQKYRDGLKKHMKLLSPDSAVTTKE